MLDLSAERFLLAAAIALVLIGAAATLSAGNAAKRIAGLLIAAVGALLALAALHAPETALIAGVAVAFAQTLIAAALLVRLQEAYGGIEAVEIDAADEQSEPAEPSA